MKLHVAGFTSLTGLKEYSGMSAFQQTAPHMVYRSTRDDDIKPRLTFINRKDLMKPHAMRKCKTRVKVDMQIMRTVNEQCTSVRTENQR